MVRRYWSARANLDKLCNNYGHIEWRAKMVMLDHSLVRQSVTLVIFIRDSWFDNFGCFANSEKHWDADLFLDLHSHQTVVAMRDSDIPYEGFTHLEGGPASLAQGKVIAKGGLTSQEAIDVEQIMERWASEVPRITVMDVGMCDLANTDFGDIVSEESIAHRYGNLVYEWNL